MDTFLRILLCFAALCVVFCREEVINRNQFPKKFLFGTSTSAYQIEGAVSEDGRGPCTWDAFTHIQGNIDYGFNADVADDHYHHYQEDIDLMHSLGVNSYRFSISWTRILPRGRFGDVNLDGIKFYNKLINNLLLEGIEPFVTLHHFDMPQELEDRYQSWLSGSIQDDFAYYADICFKNFGDRVKYWTTINEPEHMATWGYQTGRFPPGRCSIPFRNCSSGNSEVEPLIAMHNMVLSHVKAVEIYRKRYQAKQGGFIGAVLSAIMFIPYSDSEEDREAADRAMVFANAWFLDPLIYGDYPAEIKHYLGDQMPQFSKEELNKLNDGLDFIGINHYSTKYAKDCIQFSCDSGCYAMQGFVCVTGVRDGVPIGEQTPMPNFFVVPDGLEMIIGYLKTRYNNIPMFVTENGIAQMNDPSKPMSNVLDDSNRVEYHIAYLSALARSIRDGANVQGYFIWSLLDNFEWEKGYTMRFGVIYIDYETLERIPKLSAKWYQNFLTNKTFTDEEQTSFRNQDTIMMY